MMPDKCSHGVNWEDHCIECQYIADCETVYRFSPLVNAAEQRIHEYIASKAKQGNRE